MTWRVVIVTMAITPTMTRTVSVMTLGQMTSPRVPVGQHMQRLRPGSGASRWRLRWGRQGLEARPRQTVTSLWPPSRGCWSRWRVGPVVEQGWSLFLLSSSLLRMIRDLVTEDGTGMSEASIEESLVRNTSHLVNFLLQYVQFLDKFYCFQGT